MTAEPGRNDPQAVKDPVLIVQDLPLEVRAHVTNYLQEQLYTTAFEQLQDVLLAGADLPPDVPRRIFVPSAQIISLTCTLIVYPPLTSRLPSTRKPDAANKALQYLRQLTSAGRTTELPLTEPFTFASQDPNHASRRARRFTVDETLSMDETDGRLSTKAATVDSVFVRGEDFWAVVGWAFNCSIKHPERWDRWRVWLHVMLDLLEKDVRDRGQQSPPAERDRLVGNALLTRYLTFRSTSRAEKRRMMRAILADGTKKSMAEFGPLWKNETKPSKEEDPSILTSKKTTNEDEPFGDYMDMDEDDNAEPIAEPIVRKPGRPRKFKVIGSDNDDSEGDTEHSPTSTEDYGGHSSIVLRQRILGLLAVYCDSHPTYFVDLEDLCDIYSEFLRPLPLPVFAQFILPSAPYTDANIQSALIRNVLQPLLSVEAPVFRESILTQVDLQKYYLPFTAMRDNMVDNAKVGLLLEALLRLLWRHEGLRAGSRLTKAVESGWAARHEKASFDGRKKNQADLAASRYAKQVMKESEARMKLLLDVVEAEG